MAKMSKKQTGFFMHTMCIVLLISLLSISGCQGLLKPKKQLPQVNIYQGIQGLDMSFVKNAPPDEIIAPIEGEKMPFQAGIRLENKGAYDIKEGYLLLAVEKGYIDITGWRMAGEEKFQQIGASGEKVVFSLKGRSEDNPIGEADVAIADMQALPLEKQSVTHTSSVSFTSCYEYQTTASAPVCIDTDVYNLKPVEKSCTPKEVALSGGQGAPISADKIEVSILPEAAGTKGNDQKEFVSPQFVIHISNKGDGIVFTSGKSSEACSASPLKPEDINTVFLEDISFSGYSLKGGLIKCTPNPLKLRGKDDKIVCRTEKGVVSTESGTYETLIQIVLKYGYSQTISKEVKVSRP